MAPFIKNWWRKRQTRILQNNLRSAEVYQKIADSDLVMGDAPAHRMHMSIRAYYLEQAAKVAARLPEEQF